MGQDRVHVGRRVRDQPAWLRRRVAVAGPRVEHGAQAAGGGRADNRPGLDQPSRRAGLEQQRQSVFGAVDQDIE
jgi:hypothetical protein